MDHLCHCEWRREALASLVRSLATVGSSQRPLSMMTTSLNGGEMIEALAVRPLATGFLSGVFSTPSLDDTLFFFNGRNQSWIFSTEGY
jgi:hypothetical protein